MSSQDVFTLEFYTAEIKVYNYSYATEIAPIIL